MMSCQYKKTLKKRIAKEALPFIINYCESCLKRNQQRSFVRYVDQKSTEAINVENIFVTQQLGKIKKKKKLKKKLR
jgi:hypothetical protein